ncbi:MAG: Coenzyme F420 hydrogenase/dehydrogenase, beta subunit C-terminal domain [Candidatus Lokiarchaeota archaeon]|nr:Coenzyme F420 hydrogenase/dehydrogenase, beta subunit C-terminal domain [Candidatus Lokiarchaeota archaeon]
MSETKLVDEIVPKSFEDLIKEVHEKGLCGECGGCVSFCSAAELKAIEMPPSGPPVYSNKDNCLHCGLCYLVCPQTYVLNDELNERFNYRVSIGNRKKITSSQSTSEEVKRRATDGGAVTSILLYLLDHNLIKGALVCKKEGPFKRVPFFATTRQQIIEAAGSHFDLSKQVSGLEHYDTFIPTITKLKKIVGTDMMNIAVVGTPCQIHSIRKMQELSILPAHVVKYTLGLFCNFNFSFDAEARKKIEDKYGFAFEDVESMNIKDFLALQLRNNETIVIEFQDLNDIARKACFGCRDFSNVYADISFGGLGSKDEYTTTIVRTNVGEEIYNAAVKEGYLKEPIDLNTAVKKSEMLAKVISFGKRKFERYKETF